MLVSLNDKFPLRIKAFEKDHEIWDFSQSGKLQLVPYVLILKTTSAPLTKTETKKCTLPSNFNTITTPISSFCAVFIGLYNRVDADKTCNSFNATLPQPRSPGEMAIFNRAFEKMKSAFGVILLTTSTKIWLDMKAVADQKGI